VTVGRYTHHSDFLQQMMEVRASDILIGIHGAGLTHMLWLPPWAAVFELYDCEDPACYTDLAHMRGLSYVGWTELSLLRREAEPEDLRAHPGAGAKFANYEFDADEFVRKVAEAAKAVLASPDFPAERRDKLSDTKDEL
jgi:protein O-GlcNAc transferase